MQKKERFTARKLAIAGLLSALVFVSSWMQIEAVSYTHLTLPTT